MATALPPSLKTADVSRFAVRAAQLAKFKPAVSYWCEYYILQQILSKELHRVDKEAEAYAISLMTKLEDIKAQHAEDDTITDDLAAQAYIEQFATETFQRAENAVAANNASAQTVDTYRAAATFFDLLTIWQQPLEAEAATKAKYAKYHALQIAKALKAGQDPNLLNPKPAEPSPSGITVPPLDPNDPDVQRIAGTSASVYQPPSVESTGVSAPPSPPLPPTKLPEQQATPRTPDDVSPISPSDQIPGKGSISPAPPVSPGGGYFPRVPTFTSENTASTLPTAPAEDAIPDPSPSVPTIPSPPPPPQQYQSQSPSLPPPQTFSSQPSAPSMQNDPSSYYQQSFLPPQAFTSPIPPAAQAPSPYAQAAPPAAPVVPQAPAFVQPVPTVKYQPDEEAMFAAQKHAKWAISALNFEDVDTAVRELRAALKDLTGS